MTNSDISIDQVLVETHAMISELKRQLDQESSRLAQLEASRGLSVSYHVNPADYSTPEWFQ